MRLLVFLLIIAIPFGSVTAENMRVKIGTEMSYSIMESTSTPDLPEDCPCKGSKYITHGDGHRTPCPCGDNCQCSKPQGDMGDVGDQLVKDLFEPKSLCNCENCDCKDCGCLTGECKCPSKASAQEDEDMPAMTAKEKYDYTLYHMGADWCGPCHTMLKNVWPRTDNDGDTYNDDMREFLEENRIKLMLLDVTKDEDKPYFKKYGKFMRRKGAAANSRSYPTLLMFSVDDHEDPVLANIGGPGKSRTMDLIKEAIDESN